MGGKSTRRVRATRLSTQAWDVVLDAGRRADIPQSAWAELAERGMAQGERLTDAWQQVARGLGAAPTVEVTARQGAMRHRTRITVLGRVALMATRRLVGTESAMTGEPVVLVQVVPVAEIFERLVPHLPPVEDLRVDEGATGRAPVAVPILALGLGEHDQTTRVDDGAADVAPSRLWGEEPGAGDGWLSATDLSTDPTRQPVVTSRETAERIEAALGEVPAEHDLTEDETISLLAGIPGLDPRLVDLAGSVDTEVTMTLEPGGAEVSSAEEVLARLGRFAMRHWMVTGHGLVCLRADRSGLHVLGVAPGDLARELRCLLVGDLPDPVSADDILGGGA